jgi:POT family proton-dependent oligopeptide transporter
MTIHEDKAPKHPSSLWILSLIYSLYAIGFGTLFACLLLFFTQEIHLSEAHSFKLFAAFESLVFTLPLLGGYLCDRFGFNNSAMCGLIFCFIGMICLSVSHLYMTYLGLSLLLVGNAVCMPAIWSLVGMLYHKQSALRESGTTIFYLLFNIGFLIAFSASGFVAQQLNYYAMFLIFSFPILIALFCFLIFKSKIYVANEYSSTQKTNSSNVQNIISLLVILIVITPICYFLLSHKTIVNILLWFLVASAFIYLIYFSRLLDSYQSKQLYAFLCLCLFGMTYFVIYHSEFGLLPQYTFQYIDLNLNGFLVPASVITALDPFYCLIIGIIFSFLWVRLDQKNLNPNLPTKFSLGIIISSIGYLVLALLIFTHLTQPFSVLWLLIVFALFVTGELLVMPIGIAMVGRLAPEGKEGLLMGVWTLMQGGAALVTGYIAHFTVVPKGLSLQDGNHQYLQVFLISGLIILTIGIIMFISKKMVNKLI